MFYGQWGLHIQEAKAEKKNIEKLHPFYGGEIVKKFQEWEVEVVVLLALSKCNRVFTKTVNILIKIKP